MSESTATQLNMGYVKFGPTYKRGRVVPQKRARVWTTKVKKYKDAYGTHSKPTLDYKMDKAYKVARPYMKAAVKGSAMLGAAATGGLGGAAILEAADILNRIIDGKTVGQALPKVRDLPALIPFLLTSAPAEKMGVRLGARGVNLATKYGASTMRAHNAFNTYRTTYRKAKKMYRRYEAAKGATRTIRRFTTRPTY